MTTNELIELARTTGRIIMMQQYRYYGIWSAPRPVSVERAEVKAKIRVDGHCPYRFILAD